MEGYERWDWIPVPDFYAPCFGTEASSCYREASEIGVTGFLCRLWARGMTVQGHVTDLGLFWPERGVVQRSVSSLSGSACYRPESGYMT
jgi:hypothetical protein